VIVTAALIEKAIKDRLDLRFVFTRRKVFVYLVRRQ
jgi:hypothetical protein